MASATEHHCTIGRRIVFSHICSKRLSPKKIARGGAFTRFVSVQLALSSRPRGLRALDSSSSASTNGRLDSAEFTQNRLRWHSRAPQRCHRLGGRMKHVSAHSNQPTLQVLALREATAAVDCAPPQPRNGQSPTFYSPGSSNYCLRTLDCPKLELVLGLSTVS